MPDGPFIYLPGSEDNDRDTAMRLGVKPNRIIAVDSSHINVSNVKTRHGLGINGRLEDVCAAWPEKWEVSGVIADFCCGLTDGVYRFMHSLSNPAFGNAVVIINLLRGRENVSDEEVEISSSFLKYWIDEERNCYNMLSKDIRRIKDLCRGVKYTRKNKWGIKQNRHLKATCDGVSPRQKLGQAKAIIKECALFIRHLQAISPLHRGVRAVSMMRSRGHDIKLIDLPQTYKSQSGKAVQKFDSIAFRPHDWCRENVDLFNQRDGWLEHRERHIQSLRKSLIAIRAHCTMREGIAGPMFG